MLPFRMWIRVWKALKVRQKHQQSPKAATDPVHVSSVHVVLLTWFLIVLQTVRNDAGVWKVQERRGKERPFLMGSGLRVKALTERTKSRELHKAGSAWESTDSSTNSLTKCFLTPSQQETNSGSELTQTYLQSDFQDFLVWFGCCLGSRVDGK